MRAAARRSSHPVASVAIKDNGSHACRTAGRHAWAWAGWIAVYDVVPGRPCRPAEYALCVDGWFAAAERHGTAGSGLACYPHHCRVGPFSGEH